MSMAYTQPFSYILRPLLKQMADQQHVFVLFLSHLHKRSNCSLYLHPPMLCNYRKIFEFYAMPTFFQQNVGISFILKFRFFRQPLLIKEKVMALIRSILKLITVSLYFVHCFNDCSKLLLIRDKHEGY